MVLLLLAPALGCEEEKPDPRTVKGAIARAAQAVERRDARALYRLIDQRARHALHSIVRDRRRAAKLVRESYPPEARKQALDKLGDAAEAEGARDLFATRCDAACLDRFARRIAAPRTTRKDGEELVVQTVRDTTLRMYRGSHDWWGIVWHTEELDAERDRANRDYRMIKKNASIYDRRQQLE